MSDHDLLEDAAAAYADRLWFRAHPGRRYRLRPAAPAEIRALGSPGWTTHVLTCRGAGVRAPRRRPVRWTIAGDLPDSDRVLDALARGGVFSECGGGGHA